MDEECDHPRSEVTIKQTEFDEEGSSVPIYWTVFGYCWGCGNEVEIDYKFERISG